MECEWCEEEIFGEHVGTQDGNYHPDCRKHEIDEICDTLRLAWRKKNHLRLGQLLERFVFQAKDPFYHGDKETMDQLEELL